jgi:hypothetical protein
MLKWELEKIGWKRIKEYSVFSNSYQYTKLLKNMTDDFQPPIKSRRTEDLLKIVGAPNKWNPRAVKLALNELNIRKVNPAEIEEAKRLESNLDKTEEEIKADLPFNFFEIETPGFGLVNQKEVLIFLFSWNLREDGFIRKADFQRKYRPIIITILVILIIISFS